MSRQIIVLRRAREAMDHLPDAIALRIDAKIQALAQNPFPLGCLKMVNSANSYRIRVGNYRVIYTVSNTEICIAAIGHRRDIYR